MKTYAMLKTCTQALVASVIVGVAFTPSVYAAANGATDTSLAVSNVDGVGRGLISPEEKKAKLRTLHDKIDTLKDQKNALE